VNHRSAFEHKHDQIRLQKVHFAFAAATGKMPLCQQLQAQSARLTEVLQVRDNFNLASV